MDWQPSGRSGNHPVPQCPWADLPPSPCSPFLSCAHNPSIIHNSVSFIFLSLTACKSSQRTQEFQNGITSLRVLRVHRIAVPVPERDMSQSTPCAQSSLRLQTKSSAASGSFKRSQHVAQRSARISSKSFNKRQSQRLVRCTLMSPRSAGKMHALLVQDGCAHTVRFPIASTMLCPVVNAVAQKCLGTPASFCLQSNEFSSLFLTLRKPSPKTVRISRNLSHRLLTS